MKDNFLACYRGWSSNSSCRYALARYRNRIYNHPLTDMPWLDTDDMFILMWINMETRALCQFWCAMMMFCCVVFVMSCCRVTYIALATRAFMPKRRWAFMPNVPNYGQSGGYHMYNIVVYHGVDYVYFWVFWRWVLFHGLWWIAMIYDTLFCDDFCVEHKVNMMQ